MTRLTTGPRPRSVPRNAPQLTWAERVYLVLQRSAWARTGAVALITFPALFVAGLFWWNIRAESNRAAETLAGSPAFERSANMGATVAAVSEHRIFPAEFERQDGMLLGCNELAPLHPRIMLDMISAMHGKLEIYGIIKDSAQRQQILSLLEERDLPSSAVRLIELPSLGMWIRDYGPKFLRNSVGGLTIVDFAYLDVIATDGRTRPDDDRVPIELSKYFHTSMLSMPMSMEGGNLLTNGQGSCLSTTQLVRENAHRDYDVNDVHKLVCGTYRQQSWTHVPYIENDVTHHIDTFATFTAPDTAVVGSCDPLRDAQAAAAMDEAAAQLAKLVVGGRPMKVVRIPMDLRGDGVMRSYTNVVFANGTLLVPQYSDVDPGMNQRALALYAENMPGWKIVGIECLALAQRGGALHCVTCNVPSPSLLPLDLPAAGK